LPWHNFMLNNIEPFLNDNWTSALSEYCREKVPPRPQGQRSEPDNGNVSSFNASVTNCIFVFFFCPKPAMNCCLPRVMSWYQVPYSELYFCMPDVNRTRYSNIVLASNSWAAVNYVMSRNCNMFSGCAFGNFNSLRIRKLVLIVHEFCEVGVKFNYYVLYFWHEELLLCWLIMAIFCWGLARRFEF